MLRPRAKWHEKIAISVFGLFLEICVFLLALCWYFFLCSSQRCLLLLLLLRLNSSGRAAWNKHPLKTTNCTTLHWEGSLKCHTEGILCTFTIFPLWLWQVCFPQGRVIDWVSNLHFLDKLCNPKSNCVCPCYKIVWYFSISWVLLVLWNRYLSVLYDVYSISLCCWYGQNDSYSHDPCICCVYIQYVQLNAQTCEYITVCDHFPNVVRVLLGISLSVDCIY